MLLFLVCVCFVVWCGSRSRWIGRVLGLWLGLGFWCTVYLVGLSAAKRATDFEENLNQHMYGVLHLRKQKEKKRQDIPHKSTRRTTVFGCLRSANVA